MAKRRKMGRIKKYNRSFYTGPSYWIKKIGGWLLAAALIFGLGFVAAPAVIDWGTHTWYTVVKGKDLPDSSTAAPESTAQPTAAPTPAATPAPTATPVPQAQVTPGSMPVVSLSALRNADAIAATAADLKAQGAVYAMVTLKDTSGYVYYRSALPEAAGAIAATKIDPAAVAQAFREQGIQPVANIAAFQDPLVSRELGIHYTGMDYMWLDNKASAGGKRWMNPYSPDAVQYIGDLVQEACDMGFEIVVLSGVQFPRQVSTKQDFGETGGLNRAQQLTADIAAWNTRFADTVTLWYEVPYASCISPSSTLGDVMPGALGITNLVINMPAAESDEDPAATDVPVTVDQVIAQMTGDGVAHVIVRDGVTATVMQ